MSNGRQTEGSPDELDAAGRLYKTYVPSENPRRGFPQGLMIEQTFDGDGQRIKQKENTNKASYYIKSSVLGTVYEVSKLSDVWTKTLGIVSLNGQTIAFQQTGLYGSTSVGWNYQNPVTGAQRGVGSTEPDPLGTDNGINPPPPEPTDTGVSDLVIPRYADALNLAAGCEWGGMPISCDLKAATDEFDKEYARVRALFDKDKKKAPPAKKQPPTLKAAPNRSKEEIARLRAVAATGVFDNEREDVDDASVGSQTRNPNCITNAIAGSQLTKEPSEMIEAPYVWVGNKKVYNPKAKTNDHDGIHILDPRGGTYNVTALPAMAGTILHYGRQIDPKKHKYDGVEQASIVDIKLDATLDGVPLVLTIKDMPYQEGAYKTGDRVKGGQLLGTASGSSESSGIHVTLYTLQTFNKYISRRWGDRYRKSVPVGELMDAYNDPRSPFRCP